MKQKFSEFKAKENLHFRHQGKNYFIDNHSPIVYLLSKDNKHKIGACYVPPELINKPIYAVVPKKETRYKATRRVTRITLPKKNEEQYGRWYKELVTIKYYQQSDNINKGVIEEVFKKIEKPIFRPCFEYHLEPKEEHTIKAYGTKGENIVKCYKTKKGNNRFIPKVDKNFYNPDACFVGMGKLEPDTTTKYNTSYSFIDFMTGISQLKTGVTK